MCGDLHKRSRVACGGRGGWPAPWPPVPHWGHSQDTLLLPLDASAAVTTAVSQSPGFLCHIEATAKMPLAPGVLFKQVITHPDNAAIFRHMDRCSYRQVGLKAEAGRQAGSRCQRGSRWLWAAVVQCNGGRDPGVTRLRSCCDASCPRSTCQLPLGDHLTEPHAPPPPRAGAGGRRGGAAAGGGGARGHLALPGLPRQVLHAVSSQTLDPRPHVLHAVSFLPPLGAGPTLFWWTPPPAGAWAHPSTLGLPLPALVSWRPHHTEVL